MPHNVPILFTQPDCQKCDFVKDHIPEGLELDIMDLNTPDGMAEAAYHELIGKHTPLLLVDGVEVVEGAIEIKNKLISLGTVS